MSVSTPIPLHVAYENKEAVKALGARWDPACRVWWTPPGANLGEFEDWLPEWCWPADAGRGSVRADVLAFPTDCYRCGNLIAVLAGALAIDGDGSPCLVAFDDLAPFLVSQVEAATLRAAGIGAVRWRRSRLVPEGYLANGCAVCDAIQGSHPLYEDISEYLGCGGDMTSLPVVATVQLPTGILDYSERL